MQRLTRKAVRGSGAKRPCPGTRGRPAAQSRIGEERTMMNLRQALIGAASLIALTVPAVAAETVKIAFIDPLSGGAASTGENGLKHYQYLAEFLNGKQSDYKFEVTGYDNKVNPQESLVAAQKAIDAGIRIITQGNGSSVAAALLDFVQKYNDRNPGKEIVYLNYAAVDPVLTNEKCS